MEKEKVPIKLLYDIIELLFHFEFDGAYEASREVRRLLRNHLNDEEIECLIRRKALDQGLNRDTTESLVSAYR